MGTCICHCNQTPPHKTKSWVKLILMKRTEYMVKTPFKDCPNYRPPLFSGVNFWGITLSLRALTGLQSCLCLCGPWVMCVCVCVCTCVYVCVCMRARVRACVCVCKCCYCYCKAPCASTPGGRWALCKFPLLLLLLLLLQRRNSRQQVKHVKPHSDVLWSFRGHYFWQLWVLCRRDLNFCVRVLLRGNR